MAISLHENDNKNFQLALLFQQLKSKILQRSFEEVKVKTEWGYYHQPRAKPFSHTLPSSKCLNKAERAYFEQSLFGHYSGPRKTPAMERLPSTANTSAASSQMASPSMAQASPTTSQDDQGNDSPPCELLTELNVVAAAGPSVGKGKSKMIYTNVPRCS